MIIQKNGGGNNQNDVDTFLEQLDQCIERIENKVNAGNKQHHNCTLLHWFAETGHVVGIHAMLTKYKADPDVSNQKQLTPLHSAIIKGCNNAVIELVEGGAKIDSKVGVYTPLQWAQHRGNTAIVEYLTSYDHRKSRSAHDGWEL